MVDIYQPSILALLETKMVDHSKLAEELGFSCFLQSSPSGHSGGIVILGKDDNMSITREKTCFPP